MTDPRSTGDGAKSGAHDVRHTSRVIERMALFCMSSDMSDVTFIVENDRIPAHRAILVAQSDYFRAMLCGRLAEATQDEILLKDVPSKAFKLLLTYIYTGNMQLAEVEEGDLLDTLKLAHMYCFTDLVSSIANYLIQVLTLDNVLAVLEAATWDMKTLSNTCYEYFDENAEAILQHETFRNLSQDTICSLLSRDTFYVPEVQIFQAVDLWRRHNLNCEKIDVVMSKVRFSLMTPDQLLRASEILSKDNLLDAMSEQFTSTTQLPYRAMTLPEENVACTKFDCQIIQGKNPSALLNGNQTENDCLGHELDDPQGIVLELDRLYMINHIKMRLLEDGSRSYSYYVEVSKNQTDWNRVVDHRDYYCRSWQFLHFPKQAVRYIRLVGTHNTENHQFHVIALEAMYSSKTTPIKNGILMPSYNVATTDYGAEVSKKDYGVLTKGTNLQVLINGDVENYGGNWGFTAHTINNGEILVQLAQPYWLDSLRLLLWDGDHRSYSFYIETSTDLKKWDMLVDKRSDLLESWQQFTFEPRVVVCIRIVGTRNTVNEWFHCVHLECPSLA